MRVELIARGLAGASPREPTAGLEETYEFHVGQRFLSLLGRQTTPELALESGSVQTDGEPILLHRAFELLRFPDRDS